ncbi:MAG: TIGR00282 family metallophosphoesterase [Cyanobacteriota/Melainabacteria group bacterium]|nr:TIGR00282 family metallophosphoesterase [Cyanobacteria bacterium HKST-UBA01]MCB9470791.1 TIGR00282 family metallophosphoesterase [Candidatus Obscuribacterales bacterium]
MQSSNLFDVLFLGDVVGRPGRLHVREYLQSLSAAGDKPDLIIVNAENAAHGFGLTRKIVNEFVECGVHVLSGGNHTFDKKEIFEFIDDSPFILRPANYPEDTPGRGTFVFEDGDFRFGIINLMGRVFMEPLRSPFLIADELIASMNADGVKAVMVDFHAEATAEKVALGLYLDGRATAVLGTHTHVQTADERILPGGLAYITDAGLCGPSNGVIGMDKEQVFRRLVQQLPCRLEIASGPTVLSGVRFKVDRDSGKAVSIERILQYSEL